jgi:hypothetical protein
MTRTILVILVSCVPLAAQSHQLSVAAGYNYQNSDQGNGVRVNLNGWFASAQFDFNSTVSLSAEADNYYGFLRGVGVSQQNFIVGPQFTFRPDQAKFRPFVYTQAGDQRSASNGSTDHAFNLQIGGGIQIKLASAARCKSLQRNIPSQHQITCSPTVIARKSAFPGLYGSKNRIKPLF